MKEVIPAFYTRQNGTIINVSSTLGMAGIAGHSMYTATKSSMEVTSGALAAEICSFNVRVLVV